MHFSTLILAALPVLATAQYNTTSTTCTEETATATTSAYATSTASGSPELPFTVMAINSGSVIQYLPMNAAGFGFYLGGQTSSYCPTVNATGFTCPPGNETVFVGSSVSFSVEVPGGQTIYVAPSGAIGYTEAHSAYYPPGSVINPLTYQSLSEDPYPFEGRINTTAFGASGFMACPTVNSTAAASYQVFAAFTNATVPSGNVNDCIGFDGVAVPYDGVTPAAWQYT